MGLFEDIDKAKGTEGGNYFKPGTYVVQVQKCKQDKTRNDKEFFAADCKIMASNNEEMPVGASASFFILFDEYPDLSLGNVADFMRAGLCSFVIQKEVEQELPKDHNDLPLDEVTADTISGEENILAGILVNVEAYNKTTKKGNDFTRYKWSPITKEQLQELL